MPRLLQSIYINKPKGYFQHREVKLLEAVLKELMERFKEIGFDFDGPRQWEECDD